jgi:NaMN:DMB phosphoribosyltransferase
LLQTVAIRNTSLSACQLSGAGHARLVHVVAFSGRVRQWRDYKPGGLAVVDIPTDLVADLGGRRQMRVTGNLNGAAFTGSTMLVTGVGVSKAALTAANAAVGDEVQLSITATSS